MVATETLGSPGRGVTKTRCLHVSRVQTSAQELRQHSRMFWESLTSRFGGKISYWIHILYKIHTLCQWAFI